MVLYNRCSVHYKIVIPFYLITLFASFAVHDFIHRKERKGRKDGLNCLVFNYNFEIITDRFLNAPIVNLSNDPG